MPRTTGMRLPLLLALLLFAPPPPSFPGLLLLAAASGSPPTRLGPPEQPPRRSLLEEEDAAGGRGFPPQVAKEAAKDLERVPGEMPSAPEEVLPRRAWAGEPQALLLLLPPPPPPFLPREGRSPPPGPASLLPPPRRCVRLQESCVGQRLPCCDPCAACYCRFFNANCFCKRFGAPASSASAAAAFPCGRN
ncbi:agouti-related protein [Sceloporus undulatus]|uniref:agouti-related protein n=1 Tax=Sceloporus undulatus TaxID=8520 RepID=UPI001C4D1498|nr:agouti-related protein [Sceloporus undulatus]